MPKSIEDLLPEKRPTRLRIYAWSTSGVAKFKGCLKVGQTTRDVNARIRESQGVTRVKYRLEVNELAERQNGTVFRDSMVRKHLEKKGFECVEGEWVRCTAKDVLAAINELRSGEFRFDIRSENFPMRAEQRAAVKKTADYYRSIWADDKKAVPRFLWNAKMRFGKTFASYHLAKVLGAKRVLVVTFKPAVEDAWETDLVSHVDFADWQYFSKASGADPKKAKKNQPLVYFGSFQDLLGRDKKTGTIKAKNEWVHKMNWDLVIFDEYHFGAWRESAKELFEGEDEVEAKKEIQGEYGSALEDFDEALEELNESED
ncbi:MAG: restriction endonuclease, partial [Planctomycetes bacterium]|nr:restriction endonuclease [Planctomycetota bacterium]